MPPHEHDTALVVPVPDAEAAVSASLGRGGGIPTRGMPVHVTVLYPFLPEARLDPATLARLRRLCVERPVLDVEFRRTARFPGVLYLAPEPAAGFRQLTLDVAARWPEAPPYGGAFDTVVPHLTVAHGLADGALDLVEARIVRRLPIATSLPEAQLFVFDGERWRMRERLPFRTA